MGELRGLGVFDLDHTLFRKNASLEFGRYLYRKGSLSFWQALYCITAYFRHRFFSHRLDRLHNAIFQKIFKGWPLNDLAKEVETFLDAALEELLDPVVLDWFEEAKKLELHTMLLSNSPDFLVGPIAERIGFDEWSATEYAVDKEGRLCHIASYLQGAEKAVYVQGKREELRVDAQDIWVCTDSLADLPLLNVAGRCTVIRPDRKLLRIAKREGWEIAR